MTSLSQEELSVREKYGLSTKPFNLEESLTEGIDGSVAVVENTFDDEELKVREKYGLSTPVLKKDRPNGIHQVENVLDLGGSLKKEDLKRPEYSKIIRDFMVSRQGKRYQNNRINRISDEEVIDDYLEHMRFFSTNSGSTVGELAWMRDADEKDKLAARDAYQLFDKMGNVFTTGSFGDKVDGVWDYVNAQFRDPTNYLGLATGGIARVGAMGLSAGARALVKKAAIDAGRSVMLRKGSKASVAKAMREAGEQMASRMSKQMAESAHGKLLRSQAVRKAKVIETKKIKTAARDVYLRSLKTDAVRKSLYATGALDGILAVAQDAGYQQALLEVEAQDQYYYGQSAATFGLGLIGLGAQVGAGALRKKFGRRLGGELSEAEKKFMPEISAGKLESKLDPIYDSKNPKKIVGYKPLEGLKGGLETQKAVDEFVGKASARARSNIRNTELFLSSPTTYLNSPSWKKIKNKSKEGLDTEIGEALISVINTWKDKTKRGSNLKDADGKPMTRAGINNDLLKTILLGNLDTYDPSKGVDGVGGLMKVWLKNSGGVRLHKDTKAAHFFSDMIQFTSDKQINQIARALKASGSDVDVDGLGKVHKVKSAVDKAQKRRDTIGDLMAQDAADAGKTLAFYRHAKDGINAALTAAEIEMQGAVKTIEDGQTGQTLLAKFGDKGQKARPVGYAINFWRRMLVSLPKTTAVNIKGFSYMYGSNSIAEVMSSGLYLAGAMLAPNAETRRAMLSNAKIHFQIQAEKLNNILNPYDTVDDALAILEQNPDAKKIITSTTIKGVQKKGEQFGIDPTNKTFQAAEVLADGANRFSGVALQDMTTKALYFIPELDKYIRLKSQGTRSLKDYLEKGNLQDIDQESVAAAVDQTMKSVFSKDFTTEATPEVLRGIAKIVEQASNTPGLNFKIPFGRFFNNVVATMYREGPAAIPLAMSAIFKAEALSSPTVRGATKATIRKVKGRYEATITRANKTVLKDNFPTKKEATDWASQQDPASAIDQARLVNNFSRAVVGTGAIAMGTRYAYTKAEELGLYDVEGPGGSTVNLENVYPFSLILAWGEFMKQSADGYKAAVQRAREFGNEEPTIKDYWAAVRAGTAQIDPELRKDVLKQIGVGQAASDIQFGTDLARIVDVMLGDEDGNQLQKTQELARTLGTGLGGILRPLDSVNTIVGFVTDTDASKDLRQAEGFKETFAQSSTKYIDNILEAVLGKLDTAIDNPETLDKYVVGKEVLSARKDGKLRANSNPFMDILGVKYNQKSTSTEELYSVLNMKDWTADKRTNIASLDRVFNSVLAPLLENMSDSLLSDRSFMDKSRVERRETFKAILIRLRKDVSDLLESGEIDDPDREPIALYEDMQRKKFLAKKSGARTFAINQSRARGHPTNLKEMNAAQLTQLLDDAELHQQAVKDEAKELFNLYK